MVQRLAWPVSSRKCSARIVSAVTGVVHPPVRSFRRRGRMTPGRKLRWAELWPVFGLDAVDLPNWAPDVLDIGFGNGASVVYLAMAEPAWRIAALEVHEAGIVQLFDGLAAEAVTNVKVVRDDFLDVHAHVPDSSLHRINLFCPDPWPKAAQAHRRIVRPAVIDEFVRMLRVGGVLHMATDWPAYEQQMREVCERADLEPCTAPLRAVTKYEERGRRQGRPTVDLAYRRVEPLVHSEGR